MPNDLVISTRRTLAPTTFAEARDFARELAKSDMVPKEYRGKPENILLAMQWGMEVGLAPLQALQNIAVINGKPSVYGDALVALVRGSPVCDDVIETFDGEGDKLMAICEAKRIGKSPVVGRFSVEDAKKANLWGKPGPWQQYPRRMLQMRARGFALRDAFPDVLRGVITREEAEDYPVDTGTGRMVDVTPPKDTPAQSAAKQGTDSFRAYWKGLTADERAMLRPDLDEYQRLAEVADREKAQDEDPFGLPPREAEPESPAGAPQPEPQEVTDHTPHEPAGDLLEHPLAIMIRGELNLARTPADVVAIEMRHRQALNAMPHDQWLPVQEAIDRRKAELAN